MTHAEDAPGSSDLVVVANRLPLDIDEDGGWQRSPGGLVTALEPTLRARKGAWVGWPGRPDVEAEPFDDDGLAIRPVPISADEVAEYYEGFANATLWPLYHDVVATPRFERSWWEAYRRVNERFADAAARGGGAGGDGLGAGLPAPAGPPPAARAPTGPAHRVLPAHPVPAPRALRPAAVAGRRGGGAAGCRRRRLPDRRAAPGTSVASPPGSPTPRPTPRPATRPPHRARRPHRQRRRPPDLGGRAPARRDGPRPGDGRARRGPAPRARRPAHRAARRRPPRLHQGHRRPPAGVRGGPGRRAARPRRDGPGPGGDAQPRARRALRRDARRHRADRRAASTASTPRSAGR